MMMKSRICTNAESAQKTTYPLIVQALAPYMVLVRHIFTTLDSIHPIRQIWQMIPFPYLDICWSNFDVEVI